MTKRTLFTHLFSHVVDPLSVMTRGFQTVSICHVTTEWCTVYLGHSPPPSPPGHPSCMHAASYIHFQSAGGHLLYSGLVQCNRCTRRYSLKEARRGRGSITLWGFTQHFIVCSIYKSIYTLHPILLPDVGKEIESSVLRQSSRWDISSGHGGVIHIWLG